MNEYIPSGVVTAIALILYCFIFSRSRKPLYEEKPININEVTDWRYRLKLTVESAAEILGVPEDTLLGLESGKYDITKRTKLALLACELAYIAADQYVKDYPSQSHNYTHRGYANALGRIAIRKSFLDEGFNNRSDPLIITISPNSSIQYLP